MKKLGAGKHEKTIQVLVDETSKAIKQTCAPALGSRHVCEDAKKFHEFGNCLKSQFMPTVMGKVSELMPLVAEPMCQKEKAYFEKPDFWENVIPEYITKYALLLAECCIRAKLGLWG